MKKSGFNIKQEAADDDQDGQKIMMSESKPLNQDQMEVKSEYKFKNWKRYHWIHRQKIAKLPFKETISDLDTDKMTWHTISN